jgi:hypothetical protein
MQGRDSAWRCEKSGAGGAGGLFVGGVRIGALMTLLLERQGFDVYAYARGGRGAFRKVVQGQDVSGFGGRGGIALVADMQSQVVLATRLSTQSRIGKASVGKVRR